MVQAPVHPSQPPCWRHNPRVAQSNVATLATSHAQSSQPNPIPSQSPGKSSLLTIAPPTIQRRRGSTTPHMVVKRTSDRDARVLSHKKRRSRQDVMLPASQHALSSYPVSPSAPSKRSNTIALARPATQTLSTTEDITAGWQIRQRAQPFGCQPTPPGASRRHSSSYPSSSVCSRNSHCRLPSSAYH